MTVEVVCGTRGKHGAFRLPFYRTLPKRGKNGKDGWAAGKGNDGENGGPMTPQELEREALRHAKQKAREDAEREILQAKIDRTFRQEQERAARVIYVQENRGRWVRNTLFWTFMVLSSMAFAGIPLLIYGGVKLYKRRR